MIIAIDIDDTICDMQQTAISIFNARYNANYSIADFREYEVMNCMPVDHATKMIDIYGESGFYNHVKPFKGAQNGIQKLIDKGHQVYLVTNAIPRTYGEKVEFIKRYFPYIDESHIVSMKHKHLFRCDVMIDDCMQNLLAGTNYHRICYNQPWNSSNKDWVYGIYRCDNWTSVLAAVNEINELE